jgi:hypothetical protein
MMNSPSALHNRIVPTVSEDEQHGALVVTGDLSALPRSVRWRIQLGLLQDPSLTIAPRSCTLEDVTELNRQMIINQGERFKYLVEKYVEEDVNENDNNNSGDETNNNNNKGNDTAAAASTSAMLDPLTAMVMEEEARETRKAELYLKYRKERARRKRGLSTEARIIESESGDEVDRASVSTFVLCCLLNVYLECCNSILCFSMCCICHNQIFFCIPFDIVGHY